MEKVLIITGGNKGIGRGIAEAYLANHYHVFSISRQEADFSHPLFTSIKFDLLDVKGLEGLMEGVFKQIKSHGLKKIVLVNNAGTLSQIGRIEDLEASAAVEGMHLNTIAPLLLSKAFIRCSADLEDVDRKIINISSGAAQNPYYGWGIYGASKAALDMITKIIAIEQTNGVKTLGIYPGVVDTNMQTHIRKQKVEDFASLDRFLKLKENGELADPAIVGQKIFDLEQLNHPSGTIIRVDN